MDKTRTKPFGWSASVLVLVVASAAHGAILNGVTSDSGIQQFNQGTTAADFVTDGDGVLGNVNDITMRVGQTTGNGGVTNGPNIHHAGANAVFVFQLPSLNPGEQFASASLTFTITGLAANNNKSFTVDLYGLGARTGNAVTTNDYYEGTGDTTDAALLQQAIITPNSTNGANGTSTFPITVTTSLLGGDNLLDYLNAQYSSAGAGAFIFLRLNTQQPSEESASGGYQVASANNSNAGIRPFITYTIPEPASLALLGAGCLGLVRRRRL